MCRTHAHWDASNWDGELLSFLGRDPETSQLNLEKAGVQVHPQTNKIVGKDNEQTTVSHIYAIGDVLQVNCNNVIHQTTAELPKKKNSMFT